ncbi:xanthine dehydrogenase family protein molybdopterin-binding subunit [Skermanella sp. TT6]|uniref:Xanthine dehydrogenase family protein molybdopterin-binding subunit n=1 Tax=Skermanella cutis TaxID=2775420 RepID=A0ABX7B8U8_9PROT|nr:xanthine dehydrogenase family protein molybdopterin-binding subunit [Skermanella sp. TT6]QQP90612.1 xanthine dehydrogenase family protein molybdopterin-binding subunit [Skermanella sp. TT6]
MTSNIQDFRRPEGGRYVGSAQRRIDGKLKVTGGARYAGEFPAPGLTFGYVICSEIAHGRITRIDTSAAEAVPGVIKVLTHLNRPKVADEDKKYQDQTAPPGSPMRALGDDRIAYSGQPIGLVVAETFELARYAATLVEIEYESWPHKSDLKAERAAAYEPKEKRNGIAPAPPPRGDVDAAFAKAPVRFENEYRVAVEHHNPMEPHATTVIWGDGGKLTVYDKTQGVQNSQNYVTGVFGLNKEDVRVISPFVGGAFGSGLRPQYQLYLAVMAALDLKRSVRVVLTRDQMFTFVHRPDTIQTLALAADRDGKLQGIRHDAVAETSTFEDYQEVVVNWSGLLYDCPNTKLTYELAKMNTYTPGDMRAPGATLGVYALESAMDELAYATGIDPVDLRLKNYAEKDENEGKPFSSKELRACYAKAAERFGWSKRNPEPRSMREGRELIGWGMATGVWEAQMMQTSARAALKADGTLEVATATADIGTGTYTILAQLGADALGVPIEAVTVKIGDSSLPKSPVEGGSWAAASAGTAVQAACYTVREKLFNAARTVEGSPLANFSIDRVVFGNGRIAVDGDPSRSVTLADALAASGQAEISAEETAKPDPETKKKYSGYTHSAIFVEVRIDEELGVIRLTRVVNAVAAGRILNTKTARSQILGGVVFGIGMALHEESLMDKELGRFMNHNIAEYHIPAHADVRDIDVIFVDEHDDKASPIGVKGLGEIGIVGTAAAIANAVYHATGRRIRHLPITIDKVMGAGEA